MINFLKNKKGFTLIEVLVSVSIFSIVMLVSTGAVFSIVEANKKTHTIKSVMTNLNFALESMARDIRVGSKFGCGSGGGDCTSGGTIFSYEANRNLIGPNGENSTNDTVEYSLVDDTVDNVTVKRIQRKVSGDGLVSSLFITAREIYIESLKFYVIGSGTVAGGDLKQPKVVITIKGYAGYGSTRSDFDIQTTISQRSIDS